MIEISEEAEKVIKKLEKELLKRGWETWVPDTFWDEDEFQYLNQEDYLYEIVACDLTEEQADYYLKKVIDYFAIFNIDPPGNKVPYYDIDYYKGKAKK